MAKRNRPIKQIESIDVRELRRMFDKGLFATVNFTKKSNGENRTLNGKLNVQSALRGGEPAYDAESRGQLRVCDVNVYKDRNGNATPRHSEYRTVTAQNINWVTSKGVKYVVEKPQPAVNFIQDLKYFIGNKTVSVKLNGIEYFYRNVPAHRFADWSNATDKGAYFNRNIKGVYSFVRVG